MAHPVDTILGSVAVHEIRLELTGLLRQRILSWGCDAVAVAAHLEIPSRVAEALLRGSSEDFSLDGLVHLVERAAAGSPADPAT